jgi:hypothetical protein
LQAEILRVRVLHGNPALGILKILVGACFPIGEKYSYQANLDGHIE